jgi:hypothetical protein
MIRNQLFVLALFISSGVLLTGHSSAAAKKASMQPSDPARAAVEKVLRAELVGEVDRRDQLADTLRSQPDSAAARWQAGYVRDGKSWRSFDDPPSDADRLAQYRLRREGAPQTFAGQVELANWCKKHDLADQERAHLTAAMALAPESDQPALLARLGYRQIGNQWISREQLVEWRDMTRRADAAVRHWRAKLEKIADRLDGSPRRHDSAVASLKELADPDVIPAVEYGLCGRDEASAAVAVDAFANLPGYESSIALARSAVFSKWPGVREQATEALKSRRFEDFVPGLIGLLAIPLSANSSTQLYYDQDVPGNHSPCRLILVHNYLIAQETDDQFQVAVVRTVDYRLNEFLQGSIVSLGGGFGINKRLGNRNSLVSDLKTARGLNDLGRVQAIEAYERELSAEAVKERTEQLNRQVIQVLSGITGRDPQADPAPWWQWWDNFTDTQRIGGKQVTIVSEETESRGDPRYRLRRLSCFAAGTPVWTDQGAVAIESIKVGDTVLAQNIETGELALKPVLQTTVRPPKELLALRLGDETIVCTGGHRFWSSGEGWIKARDFAPQTLLHAVRGNVPVSSATKESTAETYNLVVADFHTYFVGKTGVLCQDLPLPRGTNCVLPGLPRLIAQLPKRK